MALVALNQFGEVQGFLGGAPLLGAGLLAYLAYGSLTVDGAAHWNVAVRTWSIRKGVLVNLFNRHPYLFWLTVGAPIVWRAWAVSPTRAAGFLVGLYSCLVGSKMLVALLVGRGIGVLHSHSYEVVVRALGLALVVFAVRFLLTGFEYLGLRW